MPEQTDDARSPSHHRPAEHVATESTKTWLQGPPMVGRAARLPTTRTRGRRAALPGAARRAHGVSLKGLTSLPCVSEVEMSEQGWRDFLAADNVEDWVVLHGGATAVFSVRSLGDAAWLAGAVARVPGIDRAGVLITIADDQLTVRLTRDIWRLEPRHVGLARAVSTVAHQHGAAADRGRAQEVQLAVAAHPEAVGVGFWRAVLGYAGLDEDNAVDPLGHGSTVWMQDLEEAKPLRHAMHVDVSVAREHVEARLAAALAAGGRIVDDSNAPAHWTLADRAGNRVCICAWPDGATGSGAMTPEPG
jgi:4a-hydroxytetrahydrobiopterin dehydratase